MMRDDQGRGASRPMRVIGGSVRRLLVVVMMGAGMVGVAAAVDLAVVPAERPVVLESAAPVVRQLALSTTTTTVAPTPTTALTPPTTTTTTVAPTTTTALAPPTTTTTTEPPVDVTAVLTAVYRWGPGGDDTITLQAVLGVEVDGWYGPATRSAHLAELERRGLPTSGVPVRPPPMPVRPVVRDDAPPLDPDCAEVACWPGYSGTYQAQVEAAVAATPAVLQSGLDGVTVVNGCWPAAEWFDMATTCVTNVFDQWGWYADGTGGHPWANSIWLTDVTAGGPNLAYVATHEVAHAYSTHVLRWCYAPDGSSYQALLYDVVAEEQFDGVNPEELLADVITNHFGFAHGNYRGSAPVSEAATDLLEEALSACQ